MQSEGFVQQCNVKVNGSDLKKGCRLGRGSFSEVYLVETKGKGSRQQSQKLALKQLNPRSIKCQESCNRAAIDLIEEGMLLSMADHPNIVTLMGISDTDPQAYLSQGYRAACSKQGKDYFLLLEVLAETLQDRLKRWSNDENSRKGNIASRFVFSKGRFFQRKTNKNVKLYERIEAVAPGVAAAMEYLHEQNIIFQDLKPDNIGFDAQSDKVKLFDFGMARTVDASMGTMLGVENSEGRVSWAGTPRYMAPEVFQGKGGSKKADVYSFGILLYVICTLNPSFGPNRIEVLRNFVCSGGRPSMVEIHDSDTKSLIRDCLRPRPNQRPTFAEIASFRLPKILNKLESSSDEPCRKRALHRSDTGSTSASSIVSSSSSTE